jgi:hypothetical protein
MSTLTFRGTKGSPLTTTEMDANLTALNADKLESTDVTFEKLDANGDVGTALDQVSKGNHSHTEFATVAHKDGSLQVGLNSQAVNGIEASATPTADKLLPLDADGELNADIKGDAATLGGSSLAAILAASGAASSVEFTSDGIWTKPAGCTHIEIYIGGSGGGGGAGGGVAGSGAAGGGGGGYAALLIDASLLGATENIVIGVGGAGQTSGGTKGTDGTATTFGSLLTANGGGGGFGGLYGSTGENIPGGSGGTIALSGLTSDKTQTLSRIIGGDGAYVINGSANIGGVGGLYAYLFNGGEGGTDIQRGQDGQLGAGGGGGNDIDVSFNDGGTGGNGYIFIKNLTL